MNDDHIDIEAWLTAPPAGRCIACGRACWEAEDVGHECGMTQPDGSRCPGVFEVDA